MKFNNAFIKVGLLCLFVTSSIGVSSQSKDQKKDKIRNLNREANFERSQSDLLISYVDEEYIIDETTGEIIGKYLGEIDGVPINIYPLSEDAAISINTNGLNQGSDLGYDLEGEGLTLILNDIGAPKDDHVLFLSDDGESRIVANNQPVQFHPTHMASIICGSDSLGLTNKGMASKAIIELSENYGQTQYAESLVSNHSVIRVGGTYHYFFDYNTFNHPYHTEVTASGNNGGEAYTMKNSSKNEITVGNIDDLFEYNSPKDVILVGTSGAGPTIDGRIKPEIVANGKGVIAASHTGTEALANGAGTSQACASVSGSLLLVQEYYDNMFDTYMKSATLKALAVHTARESGSTPGPDYFFGYGVLNTMEMVKVIEADTLQNVIHELDLVNNEVFTMDVFPSYDEPLIVTLAWTDPSGGQVIAPYNGGAIDTSLRALVNDLDIKIHSNGIDYEPYTLNRMNPCEPAKPGNNSFDNLEMIEIPRPINSDVPFTLEVSHKGSLQNEHQNFSLIITGAVMDQVDDIKRSIKLEEESDVEWASDKTLHGNLVCEGKLTINSIFFGEGSNRTISILDGGELILKNATLSNVDLYLHPGAKVHIDGITYLDGSNIYFLDSIIMTDNNAASLQVLNSSSFVYDYMDDAEIVDLVHPNSSLVESNFPGLVAEFVCLYDDQLVDTVYNICANTVLLGYQSDDYSVGVDVDADIEILSTCPLVNCQQLKIKKNRSFIYKIVNNAPVDPIIVPEISVDPVVHKYYNGIKYKSNDCDYTPINVYNG